MALTYGFYNSLNGDRRYNAEQVGELFDGILKDGIISGQGQHFAVTTANNRMQINVGTGRAWFNHTWTKNDSVMVLTVPASDVSRPRYDAVVLEVNHTDSIRANYIKVVQGSPLTNPVKPTLVNTDKIHQYPLAYILVPAGSSTIQASNIENMVGRSPTVFATGLISSTPIDTLWSQWKGEFENWFSGIKAQLSGNVVTNLQLQIDQCVRLSSKASTSQAQNGTDNNTWMTPYTTKLLADAAATSKVNALPQIYRTTYTGNGSTSRTFSFSRKPMFVLIIGQRVGTSSSYAYTCSGLYAIQGSTHGLGFIAQLTDILVSWSGNSVTFSIPYTGSIYYNDPTGICNVSGLPYSIFAICE